MEHTTEVSDGSRAGNPGRSEMAENKQMRGLRFCCGLGRGCGDGARVRVPALASLAVLESPPSPKEGASSFLISCCGHEGKREGGGSETASSQTSKTGV